MFANHFFWGGGCSDMLKIGVAWVWSPTNGNLSGLCVGSVSLLVTKILKFKVLIT